MLKQCSHYALADALFTTSLCPAAFIPSYFTESSLGINGCTTDNADIRFFNNKFKYTGSFGL